MYFFLFYLFAFAQEPETKQESEIRLEETLRVEYIMLDIVARDQSGQLITDLKATDFVVKDNRKIVQPEVFEILDYRQGNVIDDQGELVDLPIRQFILAIDTDRARFDEGLKTFAELRAFVKELSNNQPYKIKIVSLERDLLDSEFVDNSTSALTEINELEARFKRFNKPYRPPSESARDEMILFGGDDGRGMTGRRRKTTGFSGLEEAVNHLAELEAAFFECKKRNIRLEDSILCVQDELEAFIIQQERRTERVFSELEKLAGKFENLEGMKTLLFVSAGFTYQMNSTPHELASLYIDQILKSAREGHNRLNEKAKPIQMTTRGRLYMEKPFRNVVHACTNNRVVFHTFFILNTNKGFKSSISKGAKDPRAFKIFKGYGFEISEGLRGLAHESGGRYFGNQPLVPALLEALDGENFYYVLGYPAPAGRAGKFHKIKVKVKRKGVKLSYRRGYFSGDAL